MLLLINGLISLLLPREQIRIKTFNFYLTLSSKIKVKLNTHSTKRFIITVAMLTIAVWLQSMLGVTLIAITWLLILKI